MGKFLKNVGKVAKDVVGATFWVKKTVTSSDILAASAVDITSVASGGELAIEDIVIKTDSTGLATGTTFRIISDNTKGTTAIFLTKISKMGANKMLNFKSEFNDANNASETTGINSPTVLELGKKLSVRNTDAASTGAGTIDIYIKFRKLSDTATCKAA